MRFHRRTLELLVVTLATLLGGCGGNEAPSLWTLSDRIAGSELRVSMPGIEDGGKLPNQHVGGFMAYSDNSPPLRIEAFPEGTKSWSFAVWVSKNDGPFDPYFAVCDLPPAKEFQELGEGVFNIDLPNLMNPTIGADGWTLWEAARRHRIYHGPQPDEDDLGSEYVVEFRFHALDRMLGLKDGFKPKDFQEAAEGHVLDQVVIRTTYVVE